MAGGRRERRRAATAVAGAPGPAPVAPRLATARLGDLRLWLGIGLLVACAVAGARVMGAEAETVMVWRASRDLSAGSPLLGLEPTAVPRALAGEGYARADGQITGVLRWPLRAGELLPVAAVSTDAREPTRRVTVPVDPLHAPPSVLPGDVVDVWSTPRDGAAGAGSAAVPSQVLAAATVAGATTDEVGLTGDLGIVLDVPVEQVAAVVAAARSGVIDLVAVPLGSQQVSS